MRGHSYLKVICTSQDHYSCLIAFAFKYCYGDPPEFFKALDKFEYVNDDIKTSAKFQSFEATQEQDIMKSTSYQMLIQKQVQ